MTIIELSLSLALMMSLAGVVVYTVSGVGDWKKARNAAIELRNVYVAQKSFLADNPTRAVSSIVAADIVPYLAGGAASVPTVESLTGSQLSIKVNVMPPVALTGTSTYDPSGSATDGLWDVGQY
jgi:predicted lipoprotein